MVSGSNKLLVIIIVPFLEEFSCEEINGTVFLPMKVSICHTVAVSTAISDFTFSEAGDASNSG